MGVMAEAQDYRRQHDEVVRQLKTQDQVEKEIALHRAVAEIMREQKQIRYAPKFEQT